MVFNILKKNYPLLILIALYLVFSLLTVSHYLINWDAGQFALGAHYYDLNKHQPHPPGYFLFIFSGRALDYIFHDINFSFIFLNLVAGLAAIYFFYRLVFLISKNHLAAFFTSLLFIFNPIFWYYHNVALTYIFDALAAVVLGYFTLSLIMEKRNRFVWSLAFTAIICGFRPSAILVAGPLLIIQLFFLPNKLKEVLKGLVVFTVLFLLWFLPFVKIIGGFGYFFKTIVDQFSSINFIGADKLRSEHAHYFIASLIFGFNVGFVLLLFYLKGNIGFFIKNKKILLLFIPAGLLSLFYFFIHFGQVGYVLAILPFSYLLIIYPIQKLSSSVWGRVALIFLIMAEIAIFFFPLAMMGEKRVAQINYPAIFKHDLRLARQVELVKSVKPENLLLIVLRGQYLDQNGQVAAYPYEDVRALEYYLPEYDLNDLLSVKGVYFHSKNYISAIQESDSISFTKDASKAIIIADYLNPIQQPRDFRVSSPFEQNSIYNYYVGDIGGIDRFEFEGFYFNRSNE